MSNGVDNRLNYLNETKSILMTSINNIGGSLTKDSLFKDYSNQLQNIIDTTIVSQAALDDLIEEVEDINGEEVS